MNRTLALLVACLAAIPAGASAAENQALRVHNLFRSNMVIQRQKPIKIWGWAPAGQKVSVQFGEARAEAPAAGRDGRWEVTFPAQEANPAGQKLLVRAGDKTIEMDNILIGDVWVMNGQSNMAFGLAPTFESDMEIAAAHLPLLREVRISPNESETLQADIPADRIEGWTVCTPETAGKFSSIGYSFASRIQRALQVPVGIIDNARGGASLESLVPRQKFADDAIAAEYLKWVEKRQAEFDWDAALKPLIAAWEKSAAEQRAKGVAEDKLPPKPTRESIRSWNVPGRSPSDAASCYNGMFGAFKGLEIKGVLFHQGYNNAMTGSSRPKLYRALMPLMVQGWREDFNNPELPVGVIEFCAGGMTQDEDNFEQWSVDPAPYIREAQRLGIAGLPKTGFIPAYDEKRPGLHTLKKQALAVRAARWALKEVYAMRIIWDTVNLVSAAQKGDRMLLTFDKPVEPDDTGPIAGFSIADKSGKFYRARAESLITASQGIWGNKYDRTQLYVWSPLVKEPVAVRYAWARSPMGNLKINGKPWQPVPSFRTDSWDWPEPKLGETMPKDVSNAIMKEAGERVAYRRQKEAEMAVEILKQDQARPAEPQKAAAQKTNPTRERKAAATKAAADAAAKEKPAEPKKP